jgi:hypothetical protein
MSRARTDHVWRGIRTAVLAGILTFTMAGCSPSDLSAATADDLQVSVVSIADAAAAGDTATALAAVDGLQQQLTAALDAGTVRAERGARIQAALDQVRADLQALVPTPTPEPSEEAPTAPVDPTVSDPAVTESPVVPETDDSPAEDTEETGTGNDNNGNGKSDNSGKGKADNGKGNSD